MSPVNIIKLQIIGIQKMKILFPLLAISAALLGCSSTPKMIERYELPIVNNQAVFPPLKLLSENIYQWDESISEALNIAKLAQPAGVANDMWDETDGKTVRIDRTGMGGRVVDGLIGFASGGAMGALSLDNLSELPRDIVSL